MNTVNERRTNFRVPQNNNNNNINNNNNNNTGKMKPITCHEGRGGGTDLLFL
jgi:hypothetical protein